MVKVDWKAIGELTKDACVAAGCFVLAVAHYSLVSSDGSKESRSEFIDYGDAISSILKSDMYDGYKKEAIDLVQRDFSMGTYKAIVEIIESDMYDGYKIDVIRKICKAE